MVGEKHSGFILEVSQQRTERASEPKVEKFPVTRQRKAPKRSSLGSLWMEVSPKTKTCGLEASLHDGCPNSLE